MPPRSRNACALRGRGVAHAPGRFVFLALGLTFACGEVSAGGSAGAGGETSAAGGTMGGTDSSRGGAPSLFSSGGAGGAMRVCGPREELEDRCSQPSDCVCPIGDARVECRAWLQCDSFRRLIIPECELAPGDSCPASMDAAKGTPCFANRARCDFEDGGSCYCASDSDLFGFQTVSCEAPAHWYCGCEVDGHPSGVGELGAVCEDEGFRCGDSCFSRYARACENGHWIVPPPLLECL